MTTGVIYRAPAWNENGDPVDADGNIVRLSGDSVANVGTIDGLIIGGSSGSTRTTETLSGLRGDVVSTEGMLGFPSYLRSDLWLQNGDIVEADGQRFKVVGPRLWGRPHGLTGRPARYQWTASTAN
jgi:hypothetical protein